MFSSFQKKKSGLGKLMHEDNAARREVEAAADEGLGNLTDGQASGEASGTMMAGHKAHLDKRSLDLVFAVEQMIKAKQHTETCNNDLQDRLSHANGQIERQNKDLKNLGRVIEERESSILELEQRVSEKNQKIDHMMEEYRELQSVLSGEIEELKTVLELERQNYKGMFKKYNETTADKNKKITTLEEKNSRLEIELTQMKQKFESLRQEKTHLLNMVNEFTNRMTAPFGAGGHPFQGSTGD
ncbi:hypothetical protein IDH44_15450 [Paenibacillus sp. IB182496]|uniref:Uncharacterized protein n=1 Tax=Paenibacillus sabuli TaxID=2772509 RepID=A0A927BVV6_9BACL|nr:hypothetical protein [Paenibacillus sabuli]MBD2846595.1 hypothetical protein [Paenibacillus sabuli]